MPGSSPLPTPGWIQQRFYIHFCIAHATCLCGFDGVRRVGPGGTRRVAGLGDELGDVVEEAREVGLGLPERVPFNVQRARTCT